MISLLTESNGPKRTWNMTNYHVDPNCRPIPHNCLIYVNLPTIIPATLAWCWHKARIYCTYIREAPEFKITWIDSKQTLTYMIAGPPSGQLEPQNVLTIESTCIGIVKIVSGYFQRFITFYTKQHKTFRLYLTNLMPSVAWKSIQNSRKVIKIEEFFFVYPQKDSCNTPSKRPSNCTGTQCWNFCFYIFMELEAGLSNVLITSTNQSP